MVRSLDPDKRFAILSAATQVVAVVGLAATTAQIARRAGVAEGSLYNYFSTKEDLLNTLYLEIKREIAREISVDRALGLSIQTEIKGIFCRYLRWGIDETTKRLAMAQLTVSNRITDETRRLAMQPLAAVEDVLRAAIGPAFDASPDFASLIVAGLIETTIQFMTVSETDHDAIAEAGFGALWRALGNV